MGIMTGFTLDRAGASVTYLVRPKRNHRPAARERIQPASMLRGVLGLADPPAAYAEPRVSHRD
jgi:hypothetical protein